MAAKSNDPTKRYSEQELNPSNRAYNNSVDDPDDSSTSDSGQSSIKDLKDAENNPTAQKDFYENDGKDEARRQEARDWNDPTNRYYRPSEKVQAKINKWTSGRKGALIGGGGLMGVIIMGIFLLLPLKIPGIMSMISNEAGQRVEEVTERRMKVIVARAIVQRFATSGTGVVVTGQGPFHSLYASMRTNNFEKKLAAKGITIEGTGKNTVVRHKKEVIFTLGDQDIGTGTITLLNKLDGTAAGRQALRDIVKEEIPAWRLMKRVKFSKWLRIKYGIPRYGIKNSTEADSEARIKEMQKNRLTEEVRMAAASTTELLDCVASAGEECTLDMDDKDNSAPSDHKGSKNTSDVSSTLDSANEEAINELVNNPDQNASEVMTRTLSKKFVTVGIPVIGWIDLAATIQHAIRAEAEDDYLGKAVAGLKEKNYAQLNANWSGYASQIELGAMDPAYIGTLAKQTEGIERAEGFQHIQNSGKSKGTSMALLGDTVYAASGSEATVVPVDKINSNKPSLVKEKLDEFNDATGGAAKLVANQHSTLALEAWYQTIGQGGIFGKVGDLFSTAILAVTPDKVEEWAGKFMSTMWEKILEMFGLDFNPFVTGAKWFNNAHGGATAAYNRFCKVMGCRLLSTSQAGAQNSRIATDRSEYIKDKGVFYALFSTEEPSSLANQVAINTSSDMSSNISKVASFVLNVPAKFMASTSPKSSAALPYVDLYGVDPYGGTDKDLDQPVSPEAYAGEGCPEVPEGQFDVCAIDTFVAETANCIYTPEIEECNNDTALEPENSDAAAFNFTVASYNILHSDSHTEKSMALGGCNKNPVPGDPHCAKTRGARQVNIITGQTGNPAFDLFGTQETAPEQYDYLKKNLPGYAAFPEDTKRMNNMEDGAVAIFWNTSKFTMFENGKAPGKSNTMKDITNPWVGLQTSSGQKIYVMSIHYAVSGFGGTPEGIRESSRLTLEWVKSKASADNIVIVLGDFNDHLTNGNIEPHYCMYTKDSLMQHAVDMSAKADVSEGCSKKRFGGIDHIYATPTLNLEASGWKPMAREGQVASASDHVPVYTTYMIPGASSQNGASFNVATFNIFKSDGEPEDKWKARLRRSVNVLTENNIDIAGFQEGRKNSLSAFNTSEFGGSVYDMWPNASSTAIPIVWNKTKFTKTGEKYIKATYRDGAGDYNVPVVKLKFNETGQELYFINTHDPAGDENVKVRYDNAVRYAPALNDLEKEGLPIFFTGDFNSGYKIRFEGNTTYQNKRENLTYCVLTRDSKIRDAYDVLKNKSGTCPTDNINWGEFDTFSHQNGNAVDHIFVSPGVQVNKFFRSEAGRSKNGSDVHDTIMASVVIPGDNTGVAGNWALPVKASAWASDGQRWLDQHTSRSDAWTNNIKAAVDINIGSGDSDCGEAVYAIVGGTIKSNPSKYTMQIISNINGKEVLVTYAHGSAMKTSGVVQAGDQIMKISNAGGDFPCHLHMEVLNGTDPICPQKILPLIAAKTPFDLNTIPKATPLCAG